MPSTTNSLPGYSCGVVRLFNIRVSADFDPQRLAEQPLECRRVTCGGPKLELRVPRRMHLQQRVVVAIVQLETRDRLRVTAIQAFDQAEDRRERSNRGATAPAEQGEAGMTPLRGGLTVIACDERDRFDFVRLESAKIAVLDQIVRVFVMTLVADVNPDVVKQGGIFQPFALPIGEPVDGARLIEGRHR